MNPALVCIPTYNERDNVEAITRAALAADPRLDVLIVDDSSPDGTGEVADVLARENPRVKVLHRAKKEGLGKAYLHAFRWALEHGYRYVLEMDADFSHDPKYLPRFLDEAEAGADLVLGSRYVEGGGTVNWGVGRKVISRGGSLYARSILGVRVRDLTGGFKCFRREVLEQLDLGAVQSSGYAFQIELTFRALQGRVPGEGDPDRVRGPAGRPLEDEPEDLPRGAHDGLEAAAHGVTMLEWLTSFLIALSGVFFVVDPIGVVPIFLAMTGGDRVEKARDAALRACIVGGSLLLFFAIFGGVVFKIFGVSLAGFRVAGGIVLLITALDMLRARSSPTRTTPAEEEEGAEKEDIAIVPLAMPLLAGPGAIASVMVLMSRGKGPAGVAAVLPRDRDHLRRPRTSSSAARATCRSSSASPAWRSSSA